MPPPAQPSNTTFDTDAGSWVPGEIEPLATAQAHVIMDATIHLVRMVLAPSSHANQVIWVVNVHSSKFILVTLAAASTEIRSQGHSLGRRAHATGSTIPPAAIVQDDILFTLAFEPTAAELAFATRQLGTFATLCDAPIASQRSTKSSDRTPDAPKNPPGTAWATQQTKLFTIGITYELKVTRGVGEIRFWCVFNFFLGI